MSTPMSFDARAAARQGHEPPRTGARRALRAALLPVTALAATAGSTGATDITGLSEAAVPMHGYFEIYGSGFGASPGSVLVDGVPAPFARWTDTEIVAYVPRSIGTGPAELRVVDSGGGADLVAFEVVERPGLGARVQWRQRFDAFYAYAKPVVGPDGSLYVLDNRYRLYALDPQGAVRWIVDGFPAGGLGADDPAFGNTSVDVAADGTVYSAHEAHVTALNPDGTTRWRFDLSSEQRGYIVYDTKVGPDGNVYVAASHTPVSGLGVYSLTPEGALRWSVPHVYDRTTRRQIELVFGPGPSGLQLYFAANQNSYAIALDDGEVVFDNLPQVTGFAAVSPVDGTAHSSNYAYAPDGSIQWQSPVFLNGAMTLDSFGVHYATASVGGPRIVALDTDGSLLYEEGLDLGGAFSTPDTTTVTPDDRLLFVHDTTNLLLALRAADGHEEWRIALPREETSSEHPLGFAQYWLRRPAFRPGGEVAYYLAATNTQGLIGERTHLYAIAFGKARSPLRRR